MTKSLLCINTEASTLSPKDARLFQRRMYLTYIKQRKSIRTNSYVQEQHGTYIIFLTH